MYKTILGISTAIGLALTPIVSLASDVANKETDHEKSLQRTQLRLNALIKAAARQNLLDINIEPSANSPTPKTLPETPNPTKHPIACIATNVFSFLPKTRIGKYEDLLLLKAGMITGPDQIDTGKAKTLALAYIGLGFAEEALITADTLEGPSKLAISIMAKTLMGNTSKDDTAFMQAQAECYDGANIWVHVMRDNYTPMPNSQTGPLTGPPTDYQVDQLVKQIEVLPENLRNTLGQRLGIRAAQNGDLKTAQALYRALREAEPEHAEIEQVVLNTDLQFLEALLAVNSSDAQKTSAGIKNIKSFAKTPGPYQAHALQALSLHSPKGENLYPGFLQDLDAAAQTYSAHPLGKQAQAQKMELLAKNHAFKSAIELVKTSFEVGDKYFEDSVVVIGGYVQSGLTGDDKNKKIWALEILISEKGFFSHLNDGKLLKQAGIYACAQLGMPELAGKIMPISKWKNLDAKTLKLLAISFTPNLKNRDIIADFPKYVFEQPELKAREIERAFAGKNPDKAIAIQVKLPENSLIQTAFIKNAWNEGYWSLANTGIKKQRHSNPTAKKELPKIKQELAATLSAVSPLLLTSGRSYALNDLAALQSHLNNELSLFQAFLNLGTTPIGSADNG